MARTIQNILRLHVDFVAAETYTIDIKDRGL